MQKVILCQGLPASGKTTWSKEYCEKNLGWVRVCRDDLRNMRGKYWLPRQEDLITSLEHSCIYASLNAGYNVIVDATNLHKSYINNIIQVANEFNATIEFKSFLDVSVEECIKRDLKRPNSVGEQIIRQFYNKYVNLIKPITQDINLPKAIIVDLDGSLALHNRRSPYDDEKCDTDSLCKPVYKIIENYCSSNQPLNHIVFVSGREDKCKEKTLYWLKKNCGYEINSIEIYMRKTGDNRPDNEIKLEIFNTYIKDKYYIDFVIDDRPRVIRMWKSLGLFVLNVGEGYEF